MKIKNMMVAGAMMLFTAVVTATPAFAVDCPKGSVRSSANTLGECNVKEDNSLIPTINQIINVIIGVLGLVAVVVIVRKKLKTRFFMELLGLSWRFSRSRLSTSYSRHSSLAGLVEVEPHHQQRRRF